MDKSKWFLLFIIGFLLGILLCEFYMGGDFLKMWIVFGFFVSFFCFVCRKIGVEFVPGFLFCLLAVVLGAFRFFVSFESGDAHIQNFVGRLDFEGCICEEVDVRNDKIKYTVEAKRVFVEGGERVVYGRVLVTGDRYPVYEYGDCLRISGDLQIPEAIEDFAYDKYLARYSVYAVMYRADIELVSGGSGSGNGSVFFKWIFSFKSDFENGLSRVYAEPHGSFMAGLVLGSRKGIPDYLMESFNTTGLTHIIAISGYNVTLVIVIVSGMFGFLSRKMKIVASAIFVVIFTILVGASAAVVRAAIMGVISLFALWFGRPYLVMLSLFAAAFFMNLWNPKILVYDVGFQLSFLATFGLVSVSENIEKYFGWLPKFFGIREAFAMTLSAQVFALPIILFDFGRLSIISPIANVFVLPFIPLAMMFGFFSVLIGAFSRFFGNIFGFLGYLVLELIIKFVEFFASFDFASVDVGWISWWMILVYFYFLAKRLFGREDPTSRK